MANKSSGLEKEGKVRGSQLRPYYEDVMVKH